MSRRRHVALTAALLAGACLVGRPDGFPLAPWRWAVWSPGREPAVALAAACWLLCVLSGWVAVSVLAAQRQASARGPGADTRLRFRPIRTLVTAVMHCAGPSSRTARSLLGPIGLWAVSGHMAGNAAAGRFETNQQPHPQPALSTEVTGSGDLPEGSPSDAIALVRLEFDLASLPAPVAGSAGITESWTVETGDHLWAIAATTLEDRWHRSATECEVEAYWRRLIAANRARLVDDANPDLILPGQVLVLPDSAA